MNLILLEAGELDPRGDATLTGERARHVLRVLKGAPGQQIRVGVIDGGHGLATIQRIGEDRVEIRCAIDRAPASPPPVDLLLALPRPKVLRRLWAQLAALGVGHIALTNAEKVERNYFDTHVLSAACYRPLLIEGLQQARDTHLPTVSIHRQLKVLVEDQLDSLFSTACRVIAVPGPHHSIADVVAKTTYSRVLLAIGPEGGWNDYEQRLFERHRFEPASLGPRPLRSDTAAIALFALAHDGLSRRDSRYP